MAAKKTSVKSVFVYKAFSTTQEQYVSNQWISVDNRFDTGFSSAIQLQNQLKFQIEQDVANDSDQLVRDIFEIHEIRVVKRVVPNTKIEFVQEEI